MKKYIASYENGWDIVLSASSYKEGIKDARRMQGEYGKMWSFRMVKNNN